jgi:UDP-N-acetylmuramate--alanine ligase
MEKIKIGVVFGGQSREREVSFAGGRTVYDNLNKAVFEPIPLFVDSFGNIILLSWEFVYKGSIRDFYPPAEFIPASANDFQVYAESLGDLDKQEQLKLIHKIGNKLDLSALPGIIDVAFLCLHGSDGEDGRIQGLFEYLRIPYTGSGILSSALGMNKSIQKSFMNNAGFDVPKYTVIPRKVWLSSNDKSVIFRNVIDLVGSVCVVKAANQGSSIGISILQNSNIEKFVEAVNKAFFVRVITKVEWDSMSFQEKVILLREVCDIRESVGLPLTIGSRTIYHPEELLSILMDLFADNESAVTLIGQDGESEVLIESFIDGKEFSCIVIQDQNGDPIALPPTEIRKGKELFDYRSKYLPGLSRKITPIQIPDDDINFIRHQCEKLFNALHFNVYARIDGFITNEGKVFLNDPNTTSGMMPSSFFFHQAAEIGLNPSQFISYIIATSLKSRIDDFKSYSKFPLLLNRLNKLLEEGKNASNSRIRAAVILGGYSSERHISVESGRNIYEKLASSGKYDPFPVFLTGNNEDHELYTLPINALLKDNADDIKEKIENYFIHPVINEIIQKCIGITEKFSSSSSLSKPKKLTYANLAEMADVVFIALHGRPGEDGSVQRNLEKIGLPYNGSGPDTSKITIDKFQTNSILRKNGFLVADHFLAKEDDFIANPDAFESNLLSIFEFPFIAKPVDDGCSSAVKIIRSKEELSAYIKLAFRATLELDPEAATVLKIKAKEEFPRKNTILFESLITANGATRFLEVTGGMLTSYNENGKVNLEVFEASEALSEGDVLSLEEKFLAGQGQNITPARYSINAAENKKISSYVKQELGRAAAVLKIEGYARIDAFVRIFNAEKVEVIFIEVNSLPGMTPATCIFHQAAIAHYKPYEFIDKILDFGTLRTKTQPARLAK